MNLFRFGRFLFRLGLQDDEKNGLPLHPDNNQHEY